MNLKMTFLLIVLLGAGAGALFWLRNRDGDKVAAGPTTDFLNDSLDPKKITRIEVQRGKEPRFVVERTGQEWSLPGKWPVRDVELEQWLDTLKNLRTRFAPTPLKKGESLKPFGLDDDPLTIKITTGGQTHTLVLGEEPAETNRFTRATYLRLDDKPEVVRLGPGLIAALDRPQEYFLQKRLFPVERVARDEDAKDKVEQLVAIQVAVETPTSKFVIVHNDKNWTLTEADQRKDKDWEKITSKDRVDPAKLKTLLTGFPDLWAEKFVEKKDKSLADFGLDHPDYILSVTRPSGARSKLLIGKIAETKLRMVTKPAPPPQFGQPKQPPQIIPDEYRFAKLEDNDQIFEVKAEKLNDIAVPLDFLRDPQLARFKTDDVKRLEMKHGDQDLVLVKDKDKWRFEKPVKEDAETKQVEEVLDKLAGLQARDKEVLDRVDLKTVGLEKPQATIKLTLEEGKDDKKKTRDIVFDFGTKEKEKDKAYVRVEGWPRVNQVTDEVWKLIHRPVLAYRNRRILDIASADINKIEVHRADEAFTFEKDDKDWKLTAPVKANVEASKVSGLASELGKLEGVEFISDSPKADDLDKSYGLAKPKLTAKLYYKDAKKTPQTLAIGNRRDGKDDYFARLDQGPVFVVKKDLRGDLDRSSLSYRSLQLWQIDRDKIAEIDITKDGSAYRLKKDGARWTIKGNVEAEAVPSEVDDMVGGLTRLRCERFEAHQAKDPAKYGLDKPLLIVQAVAGEGKPHVIEIGKPVDKDAKSRFARVKGDEAVVVLDDKTVAPFNHTALDLIDKSLLAVNPRDIERIRVQGGVPFTLELSKDRWQVVGSPAATFLADEDAVNSMTKAWSHLRVQKYAAYGPAKIDWAQYGLDKPAATVSVVVKSEDEKAKKPTEHVLELGKEASEGARYARLDKKDFVVVLDAGTVTGINHTYLDFVDPRVLKYDSDALTEIHRQMKDGDLDLIRQEDQWRFAKPPRDADNITVNDLIDRTFRLRAKRIAAYPVKDLKPFGLDKPFAVVTLDLDAAGAKKKDVIKVGDLAKDASKKDTDERYAVINDNPTVVVLSAELSRHLVAPVLYFADRNLASFSGVDRAELVHGTRKVVFARPDSTWQMIEPVKADAEDAGLDELIRGLQRLRADQIVAEKGADLKKYGLDAPYLDWRFKTGDVDKLHLIVGALEHGPLTPSPSPKGPERRYAKLGGKDRVFLLSTKLTEKLGEEYRSRKPWGALDAAQVEQLTVVGPDKTFVLKKKDADWSVAGAPDLKVDAKKVTDTLDALAALKALHYVADTKANLQLYGLDKPAWKLEVPTAMGRRELLLGRTEGGSQRFYAVVAGSDAVFVIDDATSQRLARPLSAYIESEKKK